MYYTYLSRTRTISVRRFFGCFRLFTEKTREETSQMLGKTRFFTGNMVLVLLVDADV